MNLGGKEGAFGDLRNKVMMMVMMTGGACDGVWLMMMTVVAVE